MLGHSKHFFAVRVEAAHALGLLDSETARPALAALRAAFDRQLMQDEDESFWLPTAELYLAFAIARHVPQRRGWLGRRRQCC